MTIASDLSGLTRLCVVYEADFERALTRDLGEDFGAARPRPVRLVVRLVVVMPPAFHIPYDHAHVMHHDRKDHSETRVQGVTSGGLKPPVDSVPTVQFRQLNGRHCSYLLLW